MLAFYRAIINFFFPLIIIIIFFRMLFNKEHKQRYKEKLFLSSFNIKKLRCKTIWFHAASIGEFRSIIPIINQLDKNNNFNFLVTTVTISSAQLFLNEFRNRKNIFHRFLPIDKPNLTNYFL